VNEFLYYDPIRTLTAPPLVDKILATLSRLDKYDGMVRRNFPELSSNTPSLLARRNFLPQTDCTGRNGQPFLVRERTRHCMAITLAFIITLRSIYPVPTQRSQDDFSRAYAARAKVTSPYLHSAHQSGTFCVVTLTAPVAQQCTPNLSASGKFVKI